MGLENLLKKVDQGILTQFEKVTQQANKKLGWNKYDLARTADCLGELMYSGFGTYLSIMGATTRSPFMTGLGVGSVLVGMLGYKVAKRMNDRMELIETHCLLNTGAGLPPLLNHHRPLLLGLDVIIGAYGVNMAASSDSASSTAWGMALVCLGLSTALQKSAEYCRETTLTPPATKKNPLKVAYEKVVAFFEPKLEPVQVPASQYQAIFRI